MTPLAGKLAGLLSRLPKAVEGGSLSEVAKVIDEYRLTNEEIAEMDMEQERQLTERLKIDMGSDNLLAKSIRPAGFAVWTMLVLLIILFDGNVGDFTVEQAYIPFIKDVYIAYLSFYIGSRGLEKALRIYKR